MKDRMEREAGPLEEKIMDKLYELTDPNHVEFNRGLREARIAIRKIFDQEAGYEVEDDIDEEFIPKAIEKIRKGIKCLPKDVSKKGVYLSYYRVLEVFDVVLNPTGNNE